MKRLPLTLGLLLSMVCGQPVLAATVATDVLVISAPAVSQSLPAGRDFTVATAETLELRLDDLLNPTALASAQVVVTRGTTVIARLSALGTSTQFAATPGSYHVQVVGAAPAASSGGSFAVRVRSVASSSTIFEFVDAITVSAAADPLAATVQAQFVVSQAGSYTLTLQDQALPTALSSVDLLLLDLNNGSFTPVSLAGPCVTQNSCRTSVTLAASTYAIAIAATADATEQAGYATVSLVGPGGVKPYSVLMPVGQKATAPVTTTLSATGSYVLTLADLQSPAALASLRGAVFQGGSALGRRDSAGTVTLSGNVAGDAQVVVFAKRATNAGGSYAMNLAAGTQIALADARALPDGYDATLNLGGYRFSGTVTAAGSHQLQLADTAFVTAFSSLRALIVQPGQAVQTLSGNGATAALTASLVAGPVSVLVFGAPPSTTSNSLFGLSLKPASGGASVIEQAQGVGGLFQTRNIAITSAGSHDLNVADLKMPAAFSELAVAVMQGTSVVAQVFGGGKLSFTAVPGTYSLNVLASLGSGASRGTLAFDLSTTPLAPVITLSASPTSVAAKGTSTLTWSATDAASCTASGGWMGSRATSGSEATPALSADTTFTLACSGPGGSSTKNVTVTIAAAGGSGGGSSNSGGGGATGLLSIVLLAGAALARLRRRPS